MDFSIFEEEIKKLFEDAKNKDEFEFCCTLMRIKGMQSAGWDVINESLYFIQNTVSLIESPLDNDYKIRLALMTYCHITEMEDLYNIIANLIRVSNGERYSMFPFHSESEKIKYPVQKVRKIKELTQNNSYQEINNALAYIIDNKIRNAFFHSDYTIYNNEFRIASGEGILYNNIITPSVPIQWVMEKVEFSINAIMLILNLVSEYLHSYKEPKTIKGRLLANDDYCDVTLLVNDNGLHGFKS